eukprot:TRINITY_DN11235_c0_g1_i2.p1 TRINITY_DN11235_c0_g1~~TRINITY_DN11235_c0_g1_i2.p1  ORF type:complete len:676 (-),score=159.42 TRINITY_DN11235_c0_g1_i2:42-2069(-)
MADFQKTELDETLTASLKSNTIEWAMNMQICDLVKANPDLAPRAMQYIESRLRKETPVPVVLSLSLLEMLVKNCGFDVCKAVNEGMAESLSSIVKKKESWRYGLGRNLHKSMFGDWLPAGVGIGEDDRQLWLQASQKVLEILQLCADAFLLYEHRLRPIFNAYKRLRQEGYNFPRSEHGVAAGLCLVQGAEESPAYQAGTGASGAAAAVAVGSGYSDQAQPEPASLPAMRPSGEVSVTAAHAAVAVDLLADQDDDVEESSDFNVAAVQEDLKALMHLRASGPGGSSSSSSSTARPSDREEVLVTRLRDAREHASALVESLAQAAEDGQPFDPEYLDRLLTLVEDVNEGLMEAGCETEEPQEAAAVPPPPSVAPPTREEQERNDELLARYLQTKWEAEVAQEDEVANLRTIVRLSGGNPDEFHFVACRRCRSANQLRNPRAMFVCYRCGLAQPAQEDGANPPGGQGGAWGAQSQVPARHAPPARVICSGGTQELLIGGGGGEAGASLKSEVLSHPAAAPGSKRVPQEMSSEPLFDSSSSSAGNALLGGGHEKRAASSWQQWAKSMRSSAGSIKKLGDGLPRSEWYSELGEGGSASSLLGGPPPSKSRSGGSSASSFLSAWKGSRKGSAEGNEAPLLERVQVDDEWELIRPTDGVPYWHNSVSQVSQWEPPAVVQQR